ncbi:MAG: hypothetical protein AAFX85_20050, partial [Pseudomonadota bacterium]
DSCTFEVLFSPTVAGEVLDSFDVQSSAGNAIIDVIGTADGVGADPVGFGELTAICFNATTGQRVRALPVGPLEIDCEGNGLAVAPGDTVRILIRGIAE